MTIKEVLFSETQKLAHGWMIVLCIILVNGIALLSLFKHLIYNQPLFGTNPINNTETIIIAVLLFTVLLRTVKLETLITEDGISFRFFPVHLNFKKYSWNDLTKSYIREYAPLREYGGWGLRWSILGKGIAYNISGNKGLQLELITGKKVLIGTQKPEELKKMLEKIGQLKE